MLTAQYSQQYRYERNTMVHCCLHAVVRIDYCIHFCCYACLRMLPNADAAGCGPPNLHRQHSDLGNRKTARRWSLVTMCIAPMNTASLVVRCVLPVHGKRIFTVDCPIASPFLRFAGNVDELHTKRKRKTITLWKNTACRTAANSHGADPNNFFTAFIKLHHKHGYI